MCMIIDMSCEQIDSNIPAIEWLENENFSEYCMEMHEFDPSEFCFVDVTGTEFESYSGWKDDFGNSYLAFQNEKFATQWLKVFEKKTADEASEQCWRWSFGKFQLVNIYRDFLGSEK